MGGTGSGRYKQYKADLTEDCLSIDVRWLKREGFLQSGVGGQLTWTDQTGITASIDVRAEDSHLLVSYRHRSGEGDWRTESYPIQFDTTSCHIGGERHWFICPAAGCGRRVAILYFGGIFACRSCHQLKHSSQYEGPFERGARKLARLRKRLGWPARGPVGRDMQRPKGMHRRTYVRLCREHAALVSQV